MNAAAWPVVRATIWSVVSAARSAVSNARIWAVVSAATWSVVNAAAWSVVNAAIASGSVAFGAVGDERRLEYTVIGDPVNLSAKLEKHNKGLGSCALTTRETYDLAVAQGYVPGRELETVTCTLHGVKGEKTLVIMG